MITTIILALSLIKIRFNVREQEKKRQRIYALLNTETKTKSICLLHAKQRKICSRSLTSVICLQT